MRSEWLSQNVRGWQGYLWVTQSNPLPKQGHPEQAAQHRIQAGLEYLQRRRLHSLPGQPGPGLHHPPGEEVLPRVQLELPLLQFVPVAPCPVAGHHWKESGPILLTPTLQIFVGISKVPSQPSLLSAHKLYALVHTSKEILRIYQYTGRADSLLVWTVGVQHLPELRTWKKEVGKPKKRSVVGCDMAPRV